MLIFPLYFCVGAFTRHVPLTFSTFCLSMKKSLILWISTFFTKQLFGTVTIKFDRKAHFNVDNVDNFVYKSVLCLFRVWKSFFDFLSFSLAKDLFVQNIQKPLNLRLFKDFFAYFLYFPLFAICETVNVFRTFGSMVFLVFQQSADCNDVRVACLA